MEKNKKILTVEGLPDILTPQHIANYLGISRRRVYEYCQLTQEAGGIPSFLIGASRKIKKIELIKWLDKVSAAS